MPRIVSMIASATEIVSALGHESMLVGRSHECDFPETVRDLPVTTEPRILTDGNSREIDEKIKKSLHEAVSIYRVFPEKLRELRPDIIITQTMCEVCAVSLNDVKRALDEVMEREIKIVALNPLSLEDIWEDIRRVGEAIGEAQQGRLLVIQLQKRMNAIVERAEKIEVRPRVASIEWIEPLIAGGNWMPTLIEKAGGKNLFGKAGKHSPVMKWEELVKADPDVIFVTPCGWGIRKSTEELGVLAAKPEWAKLKAVKGGRVYIADGNQYFNRPGPRIVESLEILAEVIHPEHFNFNHEGAGWIRYKTQESKL